MPGQRALTLYSSVSSEIDIDVCNEAQPKRIPQQNAWEPLPFDVNPQNKRQQSSKVQHGTQNHFSLSTLSSSTSLIPNEQEVGLPKFGLPSLALSRAKSRLSSGVSKKAYRNAGLLGQKRVVTRRWSRMISSMSGLSSSFSQGTESMGPLVPDINVISVLNDSMDPKPVLSRMSSLKCPSEMMKHLRKSASAINLSKTATFNQTNGMIKAPNATPRLRLDVDSTTFHSRKAVLSENSEPAYISAAVGNDTDINLRCLKRRNSLRPDMPLIPDNSPTDEAVGMKMQQLQRRSSLGPTPNAIELPSLYCYSPMPRSTKINLPERLTSEAKIKLKQKKGNPFSIRLARRKQIVLDLQVKQEEDLAGLIQPCRFLSDEELYDKTPRRLGQVFNNIRVHRQAWKSDYMSKRMIPLHICSDVNEWGKQLPAGIEECGFKQSRKHTFRKNTTALKLAIGSMLDCIAYDNKHEQEITIEGCYREAMHTASAFTLATVSIVQCGQLNCDK